MATITVQPRPVETSPTSGIQEAVDALPPEGGVVLIPGGRYVLRHQISPRANVALRGEGDATVLTRSLVFASALAETAPEGANDVRLTETGPLRPGDQIGIWSPSPPPEERWHYKGYNMRYLTVERVEQDGTVRGRKIYGKDEKTYRVEHEALAVNVFPAVFVQGAEGVTLESLTIDGGFDEAPPVVDDADFMTAAVLADNCRGCRIRDLTVRRWNSDGICIGGKSSDVLVTGCVCENNIAIGLHSGGGIHSARFIGNVSRFNGSGFLFCQGNRNVIVANNQIHNNRKHGIWGLGDPDRYCVVSANCAHDNGWHGIEATGGVGNVIQGNLCRNNSQAEPGEYAGIYLERHRDNVVTGNLCLDDQDEPTQADGLVTVDAAGDNLLANNHCPAPSR